MGVLLRSEERGVGLLWRRCLEFGFSYPWGRPAQLSASVESGVLRREGQSPSAAPAAPVPQGALALRSPVLRERAGPDQRRRGLRAPRRRLQHDGVSEAEGRLPGEASPEGCGRLGNGV